MDPISRRAVWDVIQDAKQGRAVVLTTHRYCPTGAWEGAAGFVIQDWAGAEPNHTTPNLAVNCACLRVHPLQRCVSHLGDVSHIFLMMIHVSCLCVRLCAAVCVHYSMEEADVLGDRIGIVARGLLRALGGSIRLKQKYGTGYQVMVALTQHHQHQQQGLRQRRRSASKPQQQQQQQGVAELSPRGVVLVGPAGAATGVVVERTPEAGGTHGRSPLGIVVPAAVAEDATASSSGSSRGSSSNGQRRSQEEQQQVAAGSPGSPRSAAAAAVSATKGAVKALFAAHLGGLGPSEENRRR